MSQALNPPASHTARKRRADRLLVVGVVALVVTVACSKQDEAKRDESEASTPPSVADGNTESPEAEPKPVGEQAPADAPAPEALGHGEGDALPDARAPAKGATAKPSSPSSRRKTSPSRKAAKSKKSVKRRPSPRPVQAPRPSSAVVPSPAGRTPLQKATAAFDIAMTPNRLSCAGARPHLEAICDIADRLCLPPADDSEQTNAARADCEQARERCDEARTRFRQHCGTID